MYTYIMYYDDSDNDAYTHTHTHIREHIPLPFSQAIVWSADDRARRRYCMHTINGVIWRKNHFPTSNFKAHNSQRKVFKSKEEEEESFIACSFNGL